MSDSFSGDEIRRSWRSVMDSQLAGRWLPMDAETALAPLTEEIKPEREHEMLWRVMHKCAAQHAAIACNRLRIAIDRGQEFDVYGALVEVLHERNSAGRAS